MRETLLVLIRLNISSLAQAEAEAVTKVEAAGLGYQTIKGSLVG